MPNQLSPDSRRVNFIVRDEVYSHLAKDATRRRLSVSRLIRQILRAAYFPKLPDKVSERATLRDHRTSGRRGRPKHKRPLKAADLPELAAQNITIPAERARECEVVIAPGQTKLEKVP